jgi:beta-lactamase regulating signal transducer with metallopeptidase domain
MSFLLENLLANRALANALGWAILHSLWQGTLAALLLAAVLGALRQQTAHFRYVASLAALGLMLGAFVGTAVYYYQPAPATSPATMSEWLPLLALTAGSAEAPLTWATCQTATDYLQWASLQVEANANWLVTCWLLGVALFAVRLMVGLAYAHRLRRQGLRPVSPEWALRFNQLARRLQMGRPVNLFESVLVSVPTVVGWLRPVVLFPVGMLTALPAHELETLLAHELAHIRRNDYLINLLQSLVEVVLFYHPALWWISARVNQEREHCCDDLAVAVSGDPVTYMKALADLAELRLRTPAPALALTGPSGQLLGRIKRLARRAEPVRWASWQHFPARALAAGGVATALLLSASHSRATQLARQLAQQAVAVVTRTTEQVVELVAPPIPPPASPAAEPLAPNDTTRRQEVRIFTYQNANGQVKTDTLYLVNGRPVVNAGAGHISTDSVPGFGFALDSIFTTTYRFSDSLVKSTYFINIRNNQFLDSLTYKEYGQGRYWPENFNRQFPVMSDSAFRIRYGKIDNWNQNWRAYPQYDLDSLTKFNYRQLSDPQAPQRLKGVQQLQKTIDELKSKAQGNPQIDGLIQQLQQQLDHLRSLGATFPRGGALPSNGQAFTLGSSPHTNHHLFNSVAKSDTVRRAGGYRSVLMTSPNGQTFSVTIDGSHRGVQVATVGGGPDRPKLFVLDGQMVDQSTVENLKPDQVNTIGLQVSGQKQYGERGKNGVVEIITIGGRSAQGGHLPIYRLDGETVEKAAIDRLSPRTIQQVRVYKGAEATQKFGEGAAHGVVEITTKGNPRAEVNRPSAQAQMLVDGLGLDDRLLIIDGVEQTGNLKKRLDKLDGQSIKSITVLDGQSAVPLYGKKAKNGAILLFTKGGAASPAAEGSTNSSFYSFGEANFWNVAPNPGRGAMNIKLNLAKAAQVAVQVTDLQGRLVSEPQPPLGFPKGAHQFKWATEGLPAGVYFINMSLDGQVSTQRMIVE